MLRYSAALEDLPGKKEILIFGLESNIDFKSKFGSLFRVTDNE